MLNSLSSAVSGLRSHQTKLDVIGNNIANVNTVGYKYDTVRFQDLFSHLLKGATAPLGGRGGINPMQVGLGTALSSIDTVHTEGALTSTGRETDLAIRGRGFFVVNDGQQNYYTRDGVFTRDSSGILVNARGLRLMGWILGEEGILDTSQPLEHIHIPLGEEMLAKETEKIVFAGNLNSSGLAVDNDPYEYEFETPIFDSLGNRHVLNVKFIKVEGSENEWKYQLTPAQEGITMDEGDSGTIKFLEDGRFDVEGSEISSLTIEDLHTGAARLEIALDFSTLTQLAAESNVLVWEQDGFYPGELATFYIEETGIITGTYSNGITRQIAQLAMANFANPEGLLKMGSNLYNLSSNSGDPRIGLPGAEGRGLMESRALEMSNVDLANEFTEMITTSRAFQANTRLIGTADEILMELINIKR